MYQLLKWTTDSRQSSSRRRCAELDKFVCETVVSCNNIYFNVPPHSSSLICCLISTHFDVFLLRNTHSPVYWFLIGHGWWHKFDFCFVQLLQISRRFSTISTRRLWHSHWSVLWFILFSIFIVFGLFHRLYLNVWYRYHGLIQWLRICKNVISLL